MAGNLVTAVFLVLELRFSVDTFNQTQMNRWGRTSTVFTNQLHRRAQTLKMLISQVDSPLQRSQSRSATGDPNAQDFSRGS
jgi:hypothetical protein